jgi:hypothetical protein
MNSMQQPGPSLEFCGGLDGDGFRMLDWDLWAAGRIGRQERRARHSGLLHGWARAKMFAASEEWETMKNGAEGESGPGLSVEARSGPSARGRDEAVFSRLPEP